MRTAAIVLVAGLAASLAACSTVDYSPEAVGNCIPETSSGEGAQSVSVSGSVDSEPEVEIPASLVAESTQRRVVNDGSGGPANLNDTVEVHFSLYKGSDGSLLTSTNYTDATKAEFTLSENLLLPGLVKTLECSQVGTRVVGVIAPVDAFGTEGSSELGIGSDETIVLVASVLTVTGPPETEEYSESTGLPKVELDADGVPTITIPSTAPPEGLRIAILKEGKGEVVELGADVTVNYRGVTWETGVQFDDSWSRGAPATFNLLQVVPGFSDAIAGRTVGTVLLVSIPAELGYGAAGGAGGAIGGTDTIVFVIDILDVTPAG